MYYPDKSHIVETDDYLRLHEHSIEKRDDGRVFSHQIIELNPAKEYDPDSPNLSLHVTNGVSHRLLRPEHDYAKKTAKERKAEEKEAEQAVVEAPQPSYVGEHENLAEQKRRDEAKSKGK